ncbi:MAG: ThiF family adenylyltransferase, partial [bacterium]|nr:ThiF family adenylyltransferase [bacterium]
KRVKLADFDIVEITNLNRIRAKLPDVGESKLTVAAREVWELDPFADIFFWKSGLNKKNIKEFITGKPPLNIMIDEMDDIGLKFLARKLCRRFRVPMLMATDNGDSVILDIERFDLEPTRPIFNGRVGENILGSNPLTPAKWLKLAAKIIDPQCMTPRLQDSLLEVGKHITGAPQLGPTAAMAGAAVAFAVRRIANNAAMPSGRYLFGLEEKFEPGYMKKNAIKIRAKKTRLFNKQLGFN